MIQHSQQHPSRTEKLTYKQAYIKRVHATPVNISVPHFS